MPPKVTDTQPAVDTTHAVEEETARAARRIVATYAEDFLDGVTLMSMLGVEPEGLIHKKVLAEHQAAAAEKPAKKTAAKKSTAKKTTAKKSTAKKTTAKKTTAKKSTAKKTTAKKSTAKATTKATAKKTTTSTKTAAADSE